MKRLVTLLVGGLLALLVFAALSLWLAMRSTPGSVWLLEQARELAPGELQLEEITGSLSAGLTFGRMTYQLDDLRIEAEQLRVRLAWLSLFQGQLQLRTVAAQRLRVFQPPGEAERPSGPLPELSLPLRLRLDRLRIARLELAVAGQDETLDEVLGRATWSGTRLEIQQLIATARGLRAEIAGRIRLAGSWPLNFLLRWQLPAAGYSGAGTIGGDLERLELDQQLSLPQPVTLTGSLQQPLESLGFDLAARWSVLDLPIDATRAVKLSAGRAELRGGLDDYRLSLATRAGVTGAPEVSLIADAQGSLQELEVTRLTLESEAGQLQGAGRIVFDGLAVQGDLVATALDPAWWLPDWPGALDFRLGGRWSEDGNFRVQVSDLQGSLRGYPVSGSLRASQAGKKLSIERGQLLVGENRLDFDLAWSPQLAGNFVIDAPDLRTLWPGLQGALRGRASVSGELDTPAGVAQLSGEAISLNGQSIGSLTMQADIDPQQNIDLALTLVGLSSGELALGDLQLSADGLVDAHRIALELGNGPVDVTLASSGSWSEQRLRQTILRGTVSAPQVGLWSLDQQFELMLAADEISVSAHCWRRELASFCLDEAASDAAGQRASAQLTSLPLNFFEALLGEGLQITGSADARLRFKRAAQTLELDAQWEQSDSRILFKSAQGEQLETRIDELKLTVQADEQRADLSGQLTADYGVTAEFGGSVLMPLSADPGLDLRLQAQVPDLRLPMPLINRYLPLERVAGRADADLRLTGSLQAPRLEGGARLLDGRAFVPQAGIDLEAVQLSLASGGEQSVATLSGSAQSGGGQLILKGLIDSDADSGLFVAFDLTGDDFEAVRFPDQTVAVSPTISARIDQELVTVSGRVLVPRARILVKELPASAQTPSGDIVVHYEVPPVAPRRRRSALDVIGSLDIALGDDVAFQAFGLDTRLVGNLRLIRSSVNDPFRAEGALRTVGGRFTAARRELNIERGVLIFSGPLDEPRVDVRATRQVTWEGREYTAGLLLTGPITEIESQVFGQPAMSDTDALSFLVLGRPASDLSGSAGTELSGSAVALGLVGLLPVTSRLEESLNLDEISFTSDGSDDASIVAGKRINDEIFVRYAYGLFDRVGTFLVRYEVGRGFSLEAGSGREQSLEIIYSIDR